MNSRETAAQIRGVSGEARDAVLQQIEASIEATSVALAQVRRTGSQASSEIRSQVNDAYHEMRSREQALRQGLREVRRASADLSSSAQAQLASDYEAYAQTVAAVEAAPQGSASSSVNR